MNGYKTLACDSRQRIGIIWEAILILSVAAGVLVIFVTIPVAIVSFQLEMMEVSISTGGGESSILSPLFPYRDSIGSFVFPGFFTGFFLVMGGVLLRFFRREIMRGRIRALGVVVSGTVQKVYKRVHTRTSSGVASSSRTGSSSYTTYYVSLCLLVNPPGEKPFEARVDEESEELFKMDFDEGSTIALIYEPRSKYVLIPEQGFDKIKHEIRRKEASGSLFVLLKQIIQNELKKSGGFAGLVFILIVVVLPFTPVVPDFSQLAGVMVYAVPLVLVLFAITVYSGLTSYVGLESQQKEKNSPVLYDTDGKEL